MDFLQIFDNKKNKETPCIDRWTIVLTRSETRGRNAWTVKRERQIGGKKERESVSKREKERVKESKRKG